MMKRHLLVLSALIFTVSVGLYSEDVVVLDDLSTTVKKEKQALDKEAIPEYSEVSPSDEVRLPDIDSDLPELSRKELTAKKTEDAKEILYFEGNVSGGYPGIFTSDFSLSRSADNNYFSFDFYHEDANGYASNKSYDGFFNKDTGLKLDGTVMLPHQVDIEYFGTYDTFEFGLQGLSPAFYSTHLQTGEFSVLGNFGVNENFKLYTEFAGNLSSWYASYIPSATLATENSTVFRYSMAPKAGFSANAGTVYDCNFYIEYDFDMARGITTFYDNRCELNYDMNLKFNPFVVSGKLAYVYAQKKSIVPFELAFSYAEEVELSVSGGLKSQKAQLYELQKESLLYSDYTSHEQTDWFADFWIRFPISRFVENKFEIEFAQTAFENGMLVADYSQASSTTGLYSANLFSGTRLNTEYQFDLIFDTSELSIKYLAWWLDCPSSVSPHSVTVDYSFSTLESKYGFSIWVCMGFGGDRTILGDIIPDVGCSAFIRASDVFKFSIVLEDTVKLFTATGRTLYGNYLKQSGGASLLVSFYL